MTDRRRTVQSTKPTANRRSAVQHTHNWFRLAHRPGETDREGCSSCTAERDAPKRRVTTGNAERADSAAQSAMSNLEDGCRAISRGDHVGAIACLSSAERWIRDAQKALGEP
jgi:hypothetical protein